MTAAVPDTAPHPTPRTLARRLAPLLAAMALQGMILWVPVEKLFMSEIGFTPASVGVMAAAYAAVVPLLEVPSGVLADRWSRSRIMVLACVALLVSSTIGGLSQSVAAYVVAAVALGGYFALSSGTVDSIVYDTVLEETGSSELYETWIGRVRMVESAAFVLSALAGGVLAEATSARTTYFVTLPFAAAAIVGFLRFEEPRLHRAAEPTSLRSHLALTVRTIVRRREVLRVLLLSALVAMLSQAVFEFGPLWLVALAAPAVLFGPVLGGVDVDAGPGRLYGREAGPDPDARGRRVRRAGAGGDRGPGGDPVGRGGGRRAGAAGAAARGRCDLRRAAAARRGALDDPGRGVVRGRHRVLGAVPAVRPRAWLARPRAGRAAHRLAADRCCACWWGCCSWCRSGVPARLSHRRRSGRPPRWPVGSWSTWSPTCSTASWRPGGARASRPTSRTVTGAPSTSGRSAPRSRHSAPWADARPLNPPRRTDLWQSRFSPPASHEADQSRPQIG